MNQGRNYLITQFLLAGIVDGLVDNDIGYIFFWIGDINDIGCSFIQSSILFRLLFVSQMLIN